VETTFHGLNNSTEYVPVGVHKMWLYNNRDVVDALVRRGCPAIGKLMALGADYGQRHNHDSAAIAAMRYQSPVLPSADYDKRHKRCECCWPPPSPILIYGCVVM